MKRFKLEFPIQGENTELFVEDLDLHKRMFSIERQLMDPHPLMIERKEDGTWFIKSQDNWSLTPEDVTRLGEKIDQEYDNSPQQNA